MVGTHGYRCYTPKRNKKNISTARTRTHYKGKTGGVRARGRTE